MPGKMIIWTFNCKTA